MGTHLRELSESYPMNTNMTGFRWFSKIFADTLDESSLSIGRVKHDTVKSVFSLTSCLGTTTAHTSCVIDSQPASSRTAASSTTTDLPETQINNELSGLF